MESIQRNPPAIFKLLASDEERFARVQQEALLYLIDTIRLGQVKDEDRPAVLYVGLEVHGGYWAHGNLFYGPNGEFLPQCWLPKAARQHYVSWNTSSALERERARLESLLRHHGHGA